MIIVSCFAAWAQPRVVSFPYEPQQAGRQQFSMDSISAVAIQSGQAASFQLIQEDFLIDIPLDPDADEFTYFLSFPVPQALVQIISDNPDVRAMVFLIYSGYPPPITIDRPFRPAFDCEPPLDFISVDTWREGLPEPNYNRILTNETHYIVHHSAGSNTNTNYTQVVRDIYLYHTEVNGWSDIGYNYLVAQNGHVYEGRGVQSVEGSGSVVRYDAVLGAHFCGRNSGTMGICLLGNYETATPSTPGISSLSSLITVYGLRKGLRPFETATHALGDLQTISGHQDGCATLCPGVNLYGLLPEIREDVAIYIDCNLDFEGTINVAIDDSNEGNGEILFLNLSSGYPDYRWEFAFGTPDTFEGPDPPVITYDSSGTFPVNLFAIRPSGLADLYAFEISVSRNVENLIKPLIFPNPVVGQTLNLKFGEPIDQAVLTDMAGKELGKWTHDLSVIQLPVVQNGFYLLMITVAGKTYARRLIVSQ